MEKSDRLAGVLAAASIENELDRKHWISVRDQYRALDGLLERLPDRRVHKAMVPLSKVAFCPGRLVHTNEVTVLLGDGYFAKCSVKTAREIVESRSNRIEQRLEKNDTAQTQIDQRGLQLDAEFGEDVIKEEFVEEEQKVKKVRNEDEIERIRQQQKERLRQMQKRDDEQIWKEINNASSKVPKEEVVKPTEVKQLITEQTETEQPKEVKGVKFNETLEGVCLLKDNESTNESESDPEEPLQCRFTWTKMARPKFTNKKDEYQTPWDIGRNYELRLQEKKQSILKKKTVNVQGMR